MSRSSFRRLARNLTRWISIPYFRSIKRRIGVLETVVDHLLASELFAADPIHAFNGQSGRQEIFEQITKKTAFESIIETGTFVGNTTGWMHVKTGLRVYSCEINRHFYLLSRKRLATFTHVHLEHGDSVPFLRKLGESNSVRQPVFFYLDAHWYDDLPLHAELELIVKHWTNFVVMVDDFQVPWDSDYGFDDYGFRRSLSYACFGAHFRKLGLIPYSPTLPAFAETGARSGCVVLAKTDSNMISLLDSIPLLKRA